MKDLFNREIDYMRISITDRCNLRCSYCMPAGVDLCTHDDIMSFDEIVSVCRQATKLGIVNFKITGGEPLIRRNCAELIRQIKGIDDVEDVTLTTNGVLLEEHIDSLISAGLKSVNISLDTLDKRRFEQITGFDKLDAVISSIDKSIEKGLKVKINAVMHNEDYLEDFFDLVKLAKDKKIDVRFIEMMPIGEGANSKFISNNHLFEILNQKFVNVIEDKEKRGHGPAKYYKVEGVEGRIGFISAIHGKFCDECNRIRMTSKGDLKSCLCFDKSINIRNFAKAKDDIGMLETIKKSVLDKPEKHVFENNDNITESKKMIEIGG